VTSSGDEVNDKLEREQFTQKYQEMHRLVREADGNTILYLGAENWPFPIRRSRLFVASDFQWRSVRYLDVHKTDDPTLR
jgi:Protein of unknown function (DUF2950)